MTQPPPKRICHHFDDSTENLVSLFQEISVEETPPPPPPNSPMDTTINYYYYENYINRLIQNRDVRLTKFLPRFLAQLGNQPFNFSNLLYYAAKYGHVSIIVQIINHRHIDRVTLQKAMLLASKYRQEIAFSCLLAAL